MKKLIPALAMLLVAAALMGTSTYAWFSANPQVSADGMSVKAASTGGLAIASYTGNVGATAQVPGKNDFSSAATAVWKNSTDAVQPTSVDAGKWWKATSASIDDYAASGDITAATGNGFYQHTKWQIKSLAETGTVNVNVTNINVTYADAESSANLNKAIRVALAVTTTTDDGEGNETKTTVWYYFAPNRTAPGQGASYTYVNATGTVATYGAQGSNTLNYTATPGTQIITGLGTNPVDIDAYVYYEGQDENCKSANAIDIDTINVEILYAIG